MNAYLIVQKVRIVAAVNARYPSDILLSLKRLADWSIRTPVVALVVPVPATCSSSTCRLRSAVRDPRKASSHRPMPSNTALCCPDTFTFGSEKEIHYGAPEASSVLQRRQVPVRKPYSFAAIEYALLLAQEYLPTTNDWVDGETIKIQMNIDANPSDVYGAYPWHMLRHDVWSSSKQHCQSCFALLSCSNQLVM